MQNVEEQSMSGERVFGDYLAKKCIAEDKSTRSWLAEQASVGRMVLIEELKPEAMKEREDFLADVRAKAAVEHPLVGSIYEASTENGVCFFAHELLPGETLKERREAGEKIRAQRFVHILRRISEANIYHESHQNATSPADLDSIHVDTHGVIRIKNLAIAGGRLPDHSLRDVLKLGSDLTSILDMDQPGATRCLTLLAWMRGDGVAKPLAWDEVRNYCEQIEQQLTEPSGVIAPATGAIRPEKRSGFVWIVAILLVGILASVMLLTKKKKIIPPEMDKPGMVTVQQGKYKTPDGPRIEVDAFRISAYEVTIGEYAEFVETLTVLTTDGEERTFDHPDQPAEKLGHRPDDWANLLAAAKTQELWNEREMNMDMPVVGVDWWDAYAYTMWKRCYLPTQELWLAALGSGAKVPSAIPVSEWLPVSSNSADRTTNGILGMAGSVSEWTREPRPSPSNPLGNPQWVIIGGSYLNPGKGAATREWVDDRSLRRPDLGFRICKDAQ
jgi:hypothetical protein